MLWWVGCGCVRWLGKRDEGSSAVDCNRARTGGEVGEDGAECVEEGGDRLGLGADAALEDA